MKKRRRRFDSQFMFSVFMVGMLIIIFVAGLVGVTGNSNVDTDSLDTPDPMATPVPTTVVFPTPEPDGPSLELGPITVNTNGMFMVAAPEGWQVQNNSYNPGQAAQGEPGQPLYRITFQSTTRLSIIDVRVMPGINYPSAETLSTDYFTGAYFEGEWRSYNGKNTETKRTVEDEIVTIWFDLSNNDNDYLGKQIAWLEDDLLHLIRIVVPANYPALLVPVEEMVLPTFQSFKDQRDSEPAWQIHPRDVSEGYLIKTPYWRGMNNAILESPYLPARVVFRSAEDTPLKSLEEASQYVEETLSPGATIIASQVTTREFSEGFLVSFRYTDTEGNSISALVALLNDENDRLYLAEMRLSKPDVDLLSLDSESPYLELRDIINTFMVLPPDVVAAAASQSENNPAGVP